ncbi:MAG TPA: MFS transporter [Steroidobacteraceae bacterium]|nr:MFS transporter [Steroidobacteraceae bacterium]
MNTRTGRGYETGLMVLLSLAFGFVFFDRNAMNFLAPFVAPELHLNNAQISLLSSGFSFAWALAGYLGGRLSDSAGRRKSFLLVTFIIFSCCSFLSGLATSFLMLLAARVAMGLAEGPVLPISQSLLMLESAESRRGFNMGFMQNFGSNLIGSTLAPLVLVALADLYGWRAAFYIAGLPGLILAALIWKFVREPPRTPAQAAAAPSDPRAQASQPVATLSGSAPAIAPPMGIAQPAGPALSPFAMVRTHNIWLCILISICLVPWMILGWVFLPLYYVNVRHFSHSDMSLLMGVLGVSAALFGFILPALSDRLGRKPVVVIFSLVGVLLPLSVLYFQGSPLLLAVLIFFGWSASGVFPLFMSTIPSETLPARYIATAIALVVGFGELIGGVLVPFGAGVAADRYGLQVTLFIQLVCAVVATILALFLRETAPAKVGALTRGRSQPSAELRETRATDAG